MLPMLSCTDFFIRDFVCRMMGSSNDGEMRQTQTNKHRSKKQHAACNSGFLVTI